MILEPSVAHRITDLTMSRLEELALLSSDSGSITRLHLTEEHRAANELVSGWMKLTGMSTRIDEAGNLIGRYEGEQPEAPALILGSHLDTVRDAGKYDGTLGVVLGIGVVTLLADRGLRLPFAIEVLGFANEEGVRFRSGLLGSRAILGELPWNVSAIEDEAGISLAEAMRQFGLNAEHLYLARREPSEIAGYLEVHIEQGPVLEAEGVPVGVVTAVSGAVRHLIHLRGVSGHAGTVPMSSRRDALACAAECALALETLCIEESTTVGTIGELFIENHATNVIPGKVSFTVDLRAPEDRVRQSVDAAFRARLIAICDRRGIVPEIEVQYESPACIFDGSLTRTLASSVVEEGLPLRKLPSGAGHDAMVMASATDTAMLFVRCREGISHNPLESVESADVRTALSVTLRTILSTAEKASSQCE